MRLILPAMPCCPSPSGGGAGHGEPSAAEMESLERQATRWVLAFEAEQRPFPVADEVARRFGRPADESAATPRP